MARADTACQQATFMREVGLNSHPVEAGASIQLRVSKVSENSELMRRPQMGAIVSVSCFLGRS